MTYTLDTTYWHANDAIASRSVHRMLLALGHILDQERRQLAEFSHAALLPVGVDKLRSRGYRWPHRTAAARQYAYARAAAKVMYGAEWHRPLARDLDILERNVRRWDAEQSEPPDLRTDLAAICRRRAAELTALAERLERAR